MRRSGELIFLTAAGHGGTDPGASNPFNLYRPEKVINLEIESEIARIARLDGHVVYRMRTTDQSWSTKDLVSAARNAKAEVVLEIHCDAGPAYTTTTRGTHAIVLPGTRSERAGALIVANTSKSTGIPNLGTKGHLWAGGEKVYAKDITRFVELYALNCVHVLTENGFINNPEDEYVLRNPSNISLIAWSHVEGIKQLVKTYPSFFWPSLLTFGAVGVYCSYRWLETRERGRIPHSL